MNAFSPIQVPLIQVAGAYPDIVEWRTIPSFPDYSASELGQIRRNRIDGRNHSIKGYIAQTLTGDYYYATVFADTKQYRRGVNRLVCEAFHGLPPTRRHQAAHNDGNSLDNRKSNLRWSTPRGNIADKVSHGTVQSGDANPSRRNPSLLARGEKHGATVLTADYVRKIRSDSSTQRDIARRFGVSQKTVFNIKKGLVWGHVV